MQQWSNMKQSHPFVVEHKCDELQRLSLSSRSLEKSHCWLKGHCESKGFPPSSPGIINGRHGVGIHGSLMCSHSCNVREYLVHKSCLNLGKAMTRVHMLLEQNHMVWMVIISELHFPGNRKVEFLDIMIPEYSLKRKMKFLVTPARKPPIWEFSDPVF